MSQQEKRMQRRGFVVSHTHWDRAWYLPFQAYRLRLVRMVDDLLELLETDASFRCFTLDGQTVLLEDYLEIRPQNRGRLQQLVHAGRLLIGPWYTLPDLFIPCGEAVIRNLQFGRESAREFGEVMNVGYLPDPFGHFAQLPQILRGFAINSFIFMRGAGEFIKDTGSLFDWRAPDGSSVLAIYLRDGYLSAGALGHPSAFGRYDGCQATTEEAEKRINAAMQLLEPLQRESSFLLPNGCDHMPPQKDLPALLQDLNRMNPDLTLTHACFPEFIDAVRNENCAHSSFEGDLIGNIHHPILLSVYSTRMYLKQQNRQAEYDLIRIAEPLLAGISRIVGIRDSKPFLDLAWRLLLRNHAHDNICGCSIDEVHDEDEVRFAEISTISRTLVTEALEGMVLKGLMAPANGLNSEKPAAEVLLFNPHPFSVKSRISCAFLIPNPDGEFSPPAAERKIAAISAQGEKLPVTVNASEAMVARSAYLETTWGRRYHVNVQAELPPLGYQIVSFSETGEKPDPASEIDGTQNRLNLLDKFSIQRFQEDLCFEYESDTGDTYSFGPAAYEPPQVAEIANAYWQPEKGGLVSLKYQLAAGSFSDHESTDHSQHLALEVEVTPGEENGLEFRVRYENRWSGGRLRALLPLGFVTESFVVDSHFRLAGRALPADVEPQRPYPGEKPYDTFHQHEFAFAENGAIRTWVANRGNPEISLVKRGNQSWFALTLHRSVSMLSVTGGALRQCGAGPAIPVAGARCLRQFEHRFAWGTGELSRTEVVRLATQFANPVYAQELPYLPQAPSKGSVPRWLSLCEIDDAWIRMTACRPWHEKGMVMRLYNMSGESREVNLRTGNFSQAWCLAALDDEWNPATEQPLLNGNINFTIEPYAIRTVIVK